MAHADLNLRQILANDLIRPIQEGKPELGWDGDPGLILTYHAMENRWELLRHDPRPGHPDRYVIEARGPVGADINEAAVNLLIRGLVDRDTRRRGNSHEDQLEALFRHNERVEKAKLDKAQDSTAESLAKFYHEAGRELGVTRTHFGF